MLGQYEWVFKICKLNHCCDIWPFRCRSRIYVLHTRLEFDLRSSLFINLQHYACNARYWSISRHSDNHNFASAYYEISWRSSMISIHLSEGSFCVCAQPMRDDVTCNVVSHWPAVYTKWPMLSSPRHLQLTRLDNNPSSPHMVSVGVHRFVEMKAKWWKSNLDMYLYIHIWFPSSLHMHVLIRI